MVNNAMPGATKGVFRFGDELALRQAQGERKSLSVRPELVEGRLSLDLKCTPHQN
jgi:hypothetical protein